MELLEGKDTEVIGRENRGRRQEGRRPEEKRIEEKEIRKAINKLKKKKAAVIDEISMEAWKYAGRKLEEEMMDLIKTIWQQRTIPNDWKRSIVVPLYKRGEKNMVSNYKGISLLCSVYNIYTEVLKNRLKKETEKKNLIPEIQAGFRKGRSTLYPTLSCFCVESYNAKRNKG